MARLTQIIVEIEANGADKVLRALNQVDGAQVKLANSTKKTAVATTDFGKKGGQSLVSFGQKWQGMVGIISTAAIPAMAAIAATKKIIEFSKEGAQLEFIEHKFNKLTSTIGTTSDALLSDLREATRGTMSDMELMSGANDLLSLGLTKTHDQTVRLTAVAGALNMNLNQLVLTITNKSIMRLDQLGLSAERVTKKFEELKAAGMSEDKAWVEALILSGEETIETMGHIADTTEGAWARMKAAKDNYFNELKKDLGISSGWWPEYWEKVFIGMDEQRQYGKAMRQIDHDTAKILSYFDSARKELHFATGAELADNIRNVGDEIATMLDIRVLEWSGLTGESATKLVEQRISSIKQYVEQFAGMGLSDAEIGTRFTEMYNLLGENIFTGEWAYLNEIQKTIDKTDKLAAGFDLSSDAMQNFLKKHSDITSLTANFGSIIKLATQYDSILEEITEQETIMANNPIGSEKYEEAKRKVEALKGSMTDLANQVTLDMFQATIAINGITEAEAAAYFKMAEDMGLISREAAHAAMDAYGNAIQTINGYQIDDKTGNIIIEAEEAYATIMMINEMQIADKTGNIDLYVRYHRTGAMTQAWADANYDFSGRAIGGPVYPGKSYLWQEPGREGELLIPEKYGRVMSNTEVAQAMRDAMIMRASANSGQTTNTTNNTNKTVNYNVNAMYKDEPVLTLSEHLHILAKLEGTA